VSKKPNTKAVNSKAWQGKVLKGIVVFLSWLPLSWIRVLAILFGTLSYYIPNSGRRVTEINLTTAFPDLSDKALKKLVKLSLIEQMKTFLELGAMWCWPKEKLLSLVEGVTGQALFDEAWSQNKGLLLVAPHTGNWELSGTFLSTQYPCTFLYQPPNVSSLEPFMVSSRERFSAKLAPTDAKGVRTLMTVLKNQELTAILPDQDPGPVGGVYAPFFQQPARTMTLLSKLIQKTECPAVAVVMQRLPGLSGGFHFHILALPSDIANKDPVVAATALNQAVEQCVAIAPEQYLWQYKRYRKPPEGVKDVYRR